VAMLHKQQAAMRDEPLAALKARRNQTTWPQPAVKREGPLVLGG